ncbi:hypothetical protein SAMN05216226_102112 [Halovenus aranensis]|jgi:hypothetical protein|uniref:Uncharacterized protein n=1 Tax=Halovenus aranensis TaxID=890420 RepID=A0A1G8SRG0_9EURY|nr:hypothetical protein [Halovenus aranensis]SDJ31811.1 hypothetical protein SAMN05216226_102112 [Halovenus aranensis]
MESLSRRRCLGLLGSLTAASLAGCTDDEQPEFLVTDTAFSLQPGGNLKIQVSVENGFQDTKQSTVEVVLRYEPEEGESEQWTQTEPLELSGATEIQREFVFEGIHDETDSLDFYEVEAQLVDDA